MNGFCGGSLWYVCIAGAGVFALCLACAGCDDAADGQIAPAASSPPSSVEAEVSPQASIAGWPNYLGPLQNSSSGERDLNLDWPAAGPRELWRKKIGTGYSSPVAVGELLVIFHRREDSEIVECFDLNSGETRWQYSYPTAYQCPFHYSSGPYSTPAIESDRVWAFGAEGTLRCLSLTDGSLVWERGLNSDYQAELGDFPIATSPIVDGPRLIVHVGGGANEAGFVALDKVTGETLWTANSDGPSDATPVLATMHGRRLVFALTHEHFLALDAETGQVHWEIPFEPKNPEWNNATTPIVSGEMVLASMFGVGSLCVRQKADGSHEKLWEEFRSLNCQFHNLLVGQGHVYGFAGSDGKLWCLEMATGDVKWKWPADKGRGVSLSVGDRAIILFEDGYLGVLRLSPIETQVQLLAMTDRPLMPAKCVSTPALCGGRLILRSDEELACFDLRQ